MSTRDKAWPALQVVCSLAFLIAMLASPLYAATLTVSNTNDNGAGSLRQAIADAATRGDTIVFSVTGTITLTSGWLVINKDLTISGPGASSLAVSGNHSSSVFNTVLGTVAISGLTIKDAIGYCGGGGAIVNGGTLTLTDTTVSGNSATCFGGGGIYNYGTLTLTNSTVSGNSAPYDGGGIYNSGTLTLTGSTISGNSATYFGGGGISNYGGATLTNSTLSGNSALYFGGGIFNGTGTLKLTNSTLSGNSAISGGGGIYSYGALVLTNSTLSGNSAANGGGIYALGGTLKNTIVANSPSGGNCAGAFASQGHNLSDDATCSSVFNQPSDLNNTPAGLDPDGLQDNGGPSQTIALLDTSLALDAIPLSDCTDVDSVAVATDQRRVARPQGAACDIGAFEEGSDSNPPTTVATPSPVPNAAGWNNTNVSVSLNATDNPGFGVDELSYSLAGAQTGSAVVSGGSASIMITAEGTTTITYFATDVAGNAESPKTLTLKIDKTRPTINFGSICPATVDIGAATTMMVAVSDSLSGVVLQSPPNGPNPLDTSTQGFKTFTVFAQDKAGNAATKACTYRVVRKLTAAGPARGWLGLKNSDDVGTRLDLKAEVFVNQTKVGEGQISNVSGGGSGFNNAVLSQIPLLLNGSPEVPVNAALKITLSGRIACSGTTHFSGTARLWFNDAQADSGFDATIMASTNSNYFLRNAFALGIAVGPGPTNTVDVFVDSKAPCPARPFTAFGTWSITLP